MMARSLFSPAQTRAARGLLGWDQGRLAKLAGLELEAVDLFEAGEGALGSDELGRIGRVFNTAGVIAKRDTGKAGEGVRFNHSRSPHPRPAQFDDWEDAE